MDIMENFSNTIALPISLPLSPFLYFSTLKKKYRPIKSEDAETISFQSTDGVKAKTECM